MNHRTLHPAGTQRAQQRGRASQGGTDLPVLREEATHVRAFYPLSQRAAQDSCRRLLVVTTGEEALVPAFLWGRVLSSQRCLCIQGMSRRPKYGLRPPTRKCPVHDSKSAGETVLQQEDKEKRGEEGGCPGGTQAWKTAALSLSSGTSGRRVIPVFHPCSGHCPLHPGQASGCTKGGRSQNPLP